VDSYLHLIYCFIIIISSCAISCLVIYSELRYSASWYTTWYINRFFDNFLDIDIDRFVNTLFNICCDRFVDNFFDICCDGNFDYYFYMLCGGYFYNSFSVCFDNCRSGGTDHYRGRGTNRYSTTWSRQTPTKSSPAVSVPAAVASPCTS
jgi:hypothetical protein